MGPGNIAQAIVGWLQDQTVKLDAFLLEGMTLREREQAVTVMRAQWFGVKQAARFRPKLEAIISEAPTDNPLLYRSGRSIVARVIGPEQARFLYEEAVRRFSDDDVEKAFRVQYNTFGAAAFLLSVGYVQAGDYEKAVELLQAGLARQPDFALFVSELSVALQALGRTDEALTLLDDWVARRAAVEPGAQREILISRGQLLLSLDRLDEAEKMFVQCLVLHPDDRLAALELGQIAAARRGEAQPERILRTHL